MKPFKHRICLMINRNTITAKCGFSVNLIIWELLAASIYVKISLKKCMRTFPSVIRTEYARLVEKDQGKAGKAMEAFEKVAKTYPYPNDMNSERELIQIAEEKASA